MFLRIVLVGVVLSLAIGGGLAWVIERPHGLPSGIPVTSPAAALKDASFSPTDTASIGGPFVLRDHRGQTVTDRDFGGRYLLVYFGYTYCADVCPAELQIMSSALDKLGADSARVQPLFVTVDPERDTVKVLADFIPHFHPQLLGLTGTVEEIAHVARQYRVYFAKETESEEATRSNYSMKHSSWIYLMDPSGKFLDRFAFGTNPDALADGIRTHL